MHTALVVSALPYTGEGFKTILAPFAFQVEMCASVEGAMEHVQQESVDLIIVDHDDKMKGVEFLTWLRSGGHVMPVILHHTKASALAAEVLNLARFCTERDALVLAGGDRDSLEVFARTIERLFPDSRLTAM